jgi:hypothetical protein
MGNATAAAAHAREVVTIQPAFSIETYLQTLHYRRQSDTDHYRDGLTKAGLPP